MKRSEYDDLAANLYLKRFHGQENVVNYGESGDEFFIIIQGIVNVLVPNNQISDWLVKWKDFKVLKEWKETDFDIRALKV